MNSLRFFYVRWPVLAAALLGLLAPTLARADFSGSYAPANWTFNANGGSGSVNTGSAPASISLTGNNNSTPGIYTVYSITVPATTTIDFTWAYSTSDINPGFDPAGYRLNGTATQLTANAGANTQGGTVSGITVIPGDVFEFFVLSTDGQLGPGVLTVSSFSWESLPPEEIAATAQALTASEGLVGGGQIYRPMPGVINAANQVAFKAFGAVGTGGIVAGNDSLLLTDTSGDLHVIGREGAIVDASPVTTLHGLFTGLLLTESGQTVAFDRIKGSSTSRDQAYFTSTDGETLEILSRTGDSAAGGGVFKSPGGAFVADSDNRIYFSATLSGAGVNAKNDSGLWQEDAGTQTLIAREGSDISSLTTDAAWLGFVQPRLSAAGDGVAFVAGLQNNPANRREKTDSTKNEVVLDGNEGGLSLILRKGDVVADADGAVLNRLLGVSRSGTGSHAVSGLLKTEGAVTRLNDAVLLAVSGGTVNLVAREGVTLVGGSTVRQVLEYHAIGDDEVIFLTDRALCRWTVADGIVVLARTGAAAPGAGSNFTRLAAVSVSEGGAVALTAQLADGKTGLWRALPGGALSLVLRSGDATTVNSNAETILAFAIQRSAGTVGAGGGAGAAINDAGTIFATLSVGNGVHVARRLYP